MEAHVHLSKRDFLDYWSDASAGGFVSMAQLKKKIDRMKMNKERQKKAMKVTGQKQFQLYLHKPGVDGLSALPDAWRDEVVPKDRTDPRAQKCWGELNDFMTSFNDTGRFCSDYSPAFANTMEAAVKPFWRHVIEMYAQALSSPKALTQVRTLLSQLSELYETAYDGIFRTQVQDGDADAFNIFQKQIVEIMESTNTTHISQPTTDIEILYDSAHAAYPQYNRICADIAEKTGGQFTPAPIKHVYRAIEKTALRPDETNRFECTNVYDVVRGALVYDTISEVLVGLQEVCKRFIVVRIKNRFVPVGKASLSGGWRDVVVNMRIKGDRSKHVLEVQIHMSSLLKVRSSLGGHFIYAKYRALSEALEVCEQSLAH